MHTALSSLRRGLRAVTPALALGTAALTATLAACADSPTSPASDPAAHSTAVRPGMLPSYTQSVPSGDTTVTTFTITPDVGGTVSLGYIHKVQIAAHAVCDPSTSGYGSTLWDSPCTAATVPITVTAKSWVLPSGRPMVTFSPDLRFVPGTRNQLWLKDTYAAPNASAKVSWCPTDGGACVDESATDRTLQRDYNDENGYVSRVIKHFSGYSVLVN